MSDPDLILNPKTNRYVKKTSQTGKRLLKDLSVPSTTHVEPTRVPEPVQQALVETCAELVVAPSKPKKKASKYRVVESSDSDSD